MRNSVTARRGSRLASLRRGRQAERAVEDPRVDHREDKKEHEQTTLNGERYLILEKGKLELELRIRMMKSRKAHIERLIGEYDSEIDAGQNSKGYHTAPLIRAATRRIVASNCSTSLSVVR